LAIEIMRLVVARACYLHAGAAAEWFASCCARGRGVSAAQHTDASFGWSFFRQSPDVVFVISQLPMFDVGERRRPLSTVGWRDFPAPSAIDADSGRSVDLSFAQTPAHRLNPFYTASDYYYSLVA
jgi:hypothetical protein